MNDKEAILVQAELQAAIPKGADKVTQGQRGLRHGEHWIAMLKEFDVGVATNALVIARNTMSYFPTIAEFRAVLISEDRRQRSTLALDPVRLPKQVNKDWIARARRVVAGQEPIPALETTP